MGAFSLWHWIVVLTVVLIMFGSGKLPNAMADMAKGIKAFRKGLSDADDGAAEGAGEGRS